jgi:UDP-N-acetylmuramate dehydrogenase
MALSPALIKEITNMVEGAAIKDAPLSSHVTFRIGGPAELLVAPGSKESLSRLISYLNQEGIRHFFLGGGSNCLFMDEGFQGVVIRLTRIRDFSFSHNGKGPLEIRAGCGLMLPALIKRTLHMGFGGLEALWGIPGALGGAIRMNAGTGEMSIGHLLEELTVLDPTGNEKILKRGQFIPNYREMILPEGSVVVQCKMILERGDKGELFDELHRKKELRRASQPQGYPSAGCVFKNPSPDRPAGALIDRGGLKGLAKGDAMVSPIHANFIVNRGRASSRDILDLIQIISTRVREEFNIELELEIKVIPECTGK